TSSTKTKRRRVSGPTTLWLPSSAPSQPSSAGFVPRSQGEYRRGTRRRGGGSGLPRQSVLAGTNAPYPPHFGDGSLPLADRKGEHILGAFSDAGGVPSG